MSFAQHFIICGLECSSGLELGESAWIETQFDSNTSDFNPLERSYKPKVLCMIPELWENFHSDAFCGLVLPQGLRFCTDKQIDRYPPKCHSLVMTKEDGEKVHGTALIFYEEVKDINICHAIHTLQKMYSTEAEGNTLKRSDHLRPVRSAAKITSERSRSLPRHYQQTRLSASSLDLSSANYDYRKDTLFVTKAITLITPVPLVDVTSQILLAMQSFVCQSNFKITVLEDLVNNLLYNIPIPNPGQSVKFWSLENQFILSMPKVPNELPLYDYSLLDFFDILGVENAIKLFTCALLEHQIIVYSSDFEKLMLVCESVTSLMYPFNWQHVYVPILPPNLENFLDAPIPYIMGLLRRTHDIELAKKGSVCIVDIDNGELDIPEELPEFPSEKDLIDELRDNIAIFGGKDGADVLKEHAIESRELLEMSSNNNHSSANIFDTSDTMEELNQMISKFETLSKKAVPIENQEHNNPRLNNAIREIFINRFVHMFHSYEHFVIAPNESESVSITPQQAETQQNFDKTSFLSDQKRSHLPFLSSFLETQTFSTFIDECITIQESTVVTQTPFSIRLSRLKEKFGESLIRTPTYEPCDNIEVTDNFVLQRFKEVVTNLKLPQVTNLDNDSFPPQHLSVNHRVFPLLEASRIQSLPKDKKPNLFLKGDRSSKSVDPGVLNMAKISLLNSSPAAIAETNWTFVNELLKECKVKTKRILLEKLGQEAVHWGHGNLSFSGSEENMLVASICDLIERIWSHGLQNRSGKSSLWHFLYKFGRANEKILPFKGLLGKQAFCSPFIRSKPYILPDHSRNVQVVLLPKKKNTSTAELLVLATIHNVSTIREIKTEIGYARAWVRLALERQNLSKFLSVLACDPILLKNLYKRYAFLRCEDEREQSLFHLQTLNTVEFSCFSNAYTFSSVLYQVLIFPSPSKSGTSPCSSNIWIHVMGSLGETSIIRVPKGVIHFCFWEENLGVITSLRLGHDNTGSQPNWLVEHILIRNEFTGHLYKFTCGRWLGAGMDDGSNERYMVGCPVGADVEMSKLIQLCARSPLQTLPTTPIKSVDPENEMIELQTMLGDAINRIVKFHLKSLNEKISYAHLMCGEFGLVHALINIFSFGYKSARLFGKNLSIWDFFLKVTMDFNQSLGSLHLNASAQSSPMNSPMRFGANTLESPRRNTSLSNLLDSPKRTPGSVTLQGTLSRANQFRRMYTKLISRIETRCNRLGKDDKFQLFVCLAAYDRLLGRIVTDLTRSVAAQHLYEETSFMRKPQLISFLSHILEAIQDISIPVDPAMTKSLER